MAQIKEYIIVNGETAAKLSAAVNKKIQDGFQPFGNIIPITAIIKVKHEDKELVDLLLQAMVKY